MLREFGLITGAIIAGLFGLFIPWLLERPFPIWPWVAFGCLGLLALAIPAILWPVYRLWMRLGMLLSKVTTPVIMALVFFFMFTPISLVIKVARKEPLKRAFHDNDSYRTENNGIRKDSPEYPY